MFRLLHPNIYSMKHSFKFSIAVFVLNILFINSHKLSAQTGNVGIGTTTPVARLHVTDSNVLFTGQFPVPASTSFGPSVSGAGTRLLWYPQKGAFRVGSVDGLHWNKDSIGINSFASGYNSKALNETSTAMGAFTTASGAGSMSMGYATTASGGHSTAMGHFSIASGSTSTAMGIFTTASGENSTAMGSSSLASGKASTAMGTSTASGENATAMGWGTKASGSSSTAIGDASNAYGFASTAMGKTSSAWGYGATAIGVFNTAKADYSLALGYLSTSSGNASTALGYYTNSKSENSLVIGKCNDTLATNRLFEIGIGTADNARKNAVTVLQTGEMGLGTTTPTARLQVADSSVLFNANGDITGIYGPLPISGEGRRMLWYPDKAAWRAGYVTGTEWDQNNIGDYSFAAGINTKAINWASVALCYNSTASGTPSASIGYNTTASGDRSTAFGDGTTASGYGSTSMGFGSWATGNSATAMGRLTIASSENSTAMGYSTVASGSKSVSMGNMTLASGANSTAMNSKTIASGDHSTAMGLFTKARSANSLVIGRYNDTTNINRIFEIGNGNADNARTNAVTVLQTGEMGIGTSTPLAHLHVTNHSVLFSSDGDIPATPGNLPVSGNGRRMLWFPDKAAWRAGYVADFQWDQASIGKYSFASGNNTVASGDKSVAMNEGSIASGWNAVAMGYIAIASGSPSVSMGLNTIAAGDRSTAFGDATAALAYGSTTMGFHTKAKSDNSVAIGKWNDTTATGRLFEVGNGSADNARNNALTVLANGNTGIGIVNPTYSLTVKGDINVDALGANDGAIANSLRFGLNSGEYIASKRTSGGNQYALDFYTNSVRRVSINNNGNVGIGTDAPAQKLHVVGNICATGAIGSCSDVRYKNGFEPLNNALHNVLAMKGFYYYWNREQFPAMQFSEDRQLGFSAQEIEKLYPELVMTDAKGYKSVDYGRLTPVLIEALKELAAQNSKQETRLGVQQQQIDLLNKQVAELMKNK